MNMVRDVVDSSHPFMSFTEIMDETEKMNGRTLLRKLSGRTTEFHK